MNKREIEIARLAYAAGICAERERDGQDELAITMANDWVEDANTHGGWHFMDELVGYPNAGPIKGLLYAAPFGAAVLAATLWFILK